MKVILPKSYLDSTMGVRAEANKDGFNNIVYSTWYYIARVQQSKFDTSDLDALIKHLTMNRDEHGLYIPKNSHDNITYKMILSQVFSLNREKNMNFVQAVLQSKAYLRPWDAITYGFTFGPKLLRPLFGLLMWIPALQMISSCKKAEKIRPKLFDFNDWKSSRFHWWFKKKQLVRTKGTPVQVIKVWKAYDGTKKETRHMQNDGKHLAVFRLYALKDKSIIMKWCAKKCRAILIEMYGEDYTYEIINRYFSDRNHPIIPMWKGYGDILK